MPGNNNKPVRCVETGQVYPSQRVAIVDMTGRYNGYTADRFKSALRTGQTCFSYHWEPADAADLEPDRTPLLGCQLREIRKQEDISRGELAAMFGHTHGWIKRMENGVSAIPPELQKWMEDPGSPEYPDKVLESCGLTRGQRAFAVGHSISNKIQEPVPVTIIRSAPGEHCIKARADNGTLYYLAPVEVAANAELADLNPLPVITGPPSGCGMRCVITGPPSGCGMRCVDTGQTWTDITSCAKDTGVSYKTIQLAAYSGRKCRGLRYEFLEGETV
ncbi:helix-turn-helix domain-containing protein [Faecalibaculum rodentium]|uniref:helix-turn-helix domain-containing protein n=1 Tax=Faecalibaculum rodentium TaxID=1702221 RepID=UPI000835FC3A|nr:helix-turn-helix transcriptional regulator [Faecalibaculum rodentium]